MSIADVFKATRIGSKAYKLHAEGNQLNEAGKREEAQKRHDEALVLYHQAYDMGLDKLNILMAYAILLMRSGDYEKAREVLLKINGMQLKPDQRFQLRINYSVCMWRLGKLDTAIETIKRAAEMAKNTAIYTTLGLYLVEKARQTGDFDEAMSFNMEAYDYDDEDASTLDNLGQLYYFMSQKSAKDGESERSAEERKQALDYFTRAIKYRPRQMTTLYYLAKMKLEDGERDIARGYIDTALSCVFSAIAPVSREEAEALKAEIG